MRAEGRDDDEQQYHQRRVAGGEADDQQDTADELNEGSDIAQEVRQTATRHRGDEPRDVHKLAPATLDEDPAQQDARKHQQQVVPLCGDAVSAGQPGCR